MTGTVNDTIIQVGIADDHDLFKKGIKLALSLYKDIRISLDAANGADLMDKLKTTQPDVILLDLRMPVMDGFAALPLIKAQYPAIKVIILSINNEEALMSKLMDMGASAHFSKNAEPAYMYQVISASVRQ
jgi:DNA-binding NarL/FixJ family response regulator